jgi:hypothetical protein
VTRALATLALLLALAPLGPVAAPSAASPPCTGSPVKIFDNSNTGSVLNGGKPPAFDTKGKSYCLTSIVTYHWNNGHGKTPGTVGLTSPTMSASATARGSAGQGGAPNVNWTGTFTNPKPVVVAGAYTCTDSDPATWSQNPGSGGKGFCQVYGTLVTSGGGAGGGTKVTQTISTKVGAVTVSGGGATKGKTSGKLALRASPDAGKPPLAVTFSISAPKVVQWRLDFGDGLFRTGFGQPPATVAHTYQREGDFRPKLTTISSATATAADTTATSVSVHATPLISIIPTPASGSPPLAVAFSLATSVQGIVSWGVDFGDGTKGGGAGNPPATVYHTYTKAGTYVAQFAVKPGQLALVYTVAQVVVGGGTPPALSLTAKPTSGPHPLAVTFTLTTSIPAQLVSWEVIFGDGARATGQGAPPATVTHIYAKAGTYAAFLVVAQQQKYGGVQYTAPRGGLAISVG